MLAGVLDIRAETSRTAGCRLLVVEDCGAQRRLLVKQLSQREPGLEVSMATTAEEALAMVAATAPHAVLCDMELPGASGLELVRLLRGTPSNPLIVLMSATPSATLQTAAKAAGADAFLPKEVAVDEFTRLLRKRFTTD
jgi:CheY-like chemotaxis protein